MLEIKISGLDALQRALDELPAKLEANILRGALRAGMKVIEAEARALVPEASGKLRDSIRVSSGIDRRLGRVRATVKAGGRKGKTSAFYAHMVEFGVKAHEIRPKGARSLFFAGISRTLIQHPGTSPKPFMRPAMDAKQSAALLAAGDYCRGRLTKEGINTPEIFLEDDEDSEGDA